MPNKTTMKRARRDKRQGKAASTQAGEFVHEEIHHVRGGKHGARSTKQAIAIGLSKARRAGVRLPPPKKGTTTARTRRSARRAYAAGRKRPPRPSARRSRGVTKALRRESRRSASRTALARQAKGAARRRSAAARSRSAMAGRWTLCVQD